MYILSHGFFEPPISYTYKNVASKVEFSHKKKITKKTTITEHIFSFHGGKNLDNHYIH